MCNQKRIQLVTLEVSKDTVVLIVCVEWPMVILISGLSTYLLQSGIKPADT